MIVVYTGMLQSAIDLPTMHPIILGHLVNDQHKFGAGIAGQIARDWPRVRRAYMAADVKTFWGHAQFVDTNVKTVCGTSVYVANLWAQRNLRASAVVDLEALRTALQRLRAAHWNAGVDIHLPYRIGQGLAHGDGRAIHQVIEEVFNGSVVTLWKLPNDPGFK